MGHSTENVWLIGHQKHRYALLVLAYHCRLWAIRCYRGASMVVYKFMSNNNKNNLNNCSVGKICTIIKVYNTSIKLALGK